MQKKTLLIIAALILILAGGWLLIRSVFGGRGRQAVLKVDATPTATLFLNDENKGTTPFESNVQPGEYTLKLIPESTVESAVSWESKVITTAGQLTYVNRVLGDSELTSAGEVLYLEKISGKAIELTVLSSPDAASVTLSGENKGTTPLLLSELEPGSFELTVSQSGYSARSVKIKITPGYKLTASFQLTTSGEPVASPEPSGSPEASGSPKASPKVSPKASPAATPKSTPTTSPTPPPKPYVEILDTPVGFLRVRAEASTSSEEVSRVNPGEFYPLLDEESGWYKIEYEKGKEGWISGQYAEKFE